MCVWLRGIGLYKITYSNRILLHFSTFLQLDSRILDAASLLYKIVQFQCFLLHFPFILQLHSRILYKITYFNRILVHCPFFSISQHSLQDHVFHPYFAIFSVSPSTRLMVLKVVNILYKITYFHRFLYIFLLFSK